MDLVDGFGLRLKFYVIVILIGGYMGWGLLKYKLERFVGVVFLVLVVNFWWLGFLKLEMSKVWNM